MALCMKLLTQKQWPLKYILTYKLSQDSIELLFNKIRQQFGCNNPNVLQFKGALRRIIIRNSIKPSKTGNCTHFEDGLCHTNGLVEFARHHQEAPQVQRNISVHTTNNSLINWETLTAGLDEMTMNPSHDNIMYYIAGYVTQALIKKEQCTECIKELLEAWRSVQWQITRS